MPQFADEAMAERFRLVFAGTDEPACGELLHDAEETCLRRHHGEDEAHITLVDGTPTQWNAVPADQTVPKTAAAEHGSA